MYRDTHAQKSRRKAREVALAAFRAGPIPGTGGFAWHPRAHKLRPYFRPRKGGGTSKRND